MCRPTRRVSALSNNQIASRRIGQVQIAADEVTAKPPGSVHDDEAAGGRIDDEIARLGEDLDQIRDQADRFHVWMLRFRMDDALDPTIGKRWTARPCCFG